MKKQIGEWIDSNLFFVAIVCFVAVLPFSSALVSICGALVLLTALIEDSWKNKMARLKQRKSILLLLGIFGIYLLSTLNTLKGNTFYDIQKSTFIFLFPLGFALGKEISAQQKRSVFYVFITAVFIASLIAVIRWRTGTDTINFSVHKASLVSHIRYSFQLILSFWFLIMLVSKNFTTIGTNKSVLLGLLASYYLFFLFFQQSLTGLLALGGSTILFVFYHLIKLEGRKRSYILIVASIILLLPLIYVGYVVQSFYNIEEIDQNNIEKYTAKGNPYHHNFNNKSVENGKYVHLYVSNDEMREEWNKISELKYDSLGHNGYSMRSTLVRYLTSKGLRKDAEGVKALSQTDIKNIENCMANVIYQKKYSLYPRIYQTVWEYYEYSTTSNSNNKSFSQRIDFAKAAITIINKNFWFGVGTGNWKKEFEKAFIENESKLDKRLYASSHNQYLNYMVKFGIIGFLVILVFLVYPIIKTRRYKDFLFMLFLAFMAFANLADSNLESHMGSSFFFFFYCFFLTTNGINYLKLQKA